MGDRFVRISQLPESTQLSPDDYIPIENDLDTWRIKVGYLNRYIENQVNIYEQKIINIVNEKITEINITNSGTQDIINDINKKLTIFNNSEAERKASEKEREQNEALRQSNELDRQKKFDSITNATNDIKDSEAARVAAENARIAAENARKTAENNRVSAENIRVSNENSRVEAEANRVTAENTRVSNENARNTSESNRRKNETDRENRFNEMEGTINNINLLFQNNSREGKNFIGNETGYLPLFEIAIPMVYFDVDSDTNESRNKYSALVYLTNGTHSNRSTYYSGSTGGTFAGVEINMMSGELTIFSYPVANTGYILESFLPFSTNEFYLEAFYEVRDGSYIITIYSNIEYSGNKGLVYAAIFWDNILKFKSSNSSYYAKALSDQPFLTSNNFGPILAPPKYKLAVGYTGNIDIYEVDNLPRGFIDLLYNILYRIKAEADNIIKLRKGEFYPVGAIYTTTEPHYPGNSIPQKYQSIGIKSVCGFGGTWELINGDGITHEFHNITEDGTDDNVTLNTVTIYMWKKVA